MGARALGFVGRGKDRHVDFPLGVREEFCKHCGSCNLLCPMTITPCKGPIKRGEEYLCCKCESQLMITENRPDSCVWCELGKNFQCARYSNLNMALSLSGVFPKHYYECCHAIKDLS